MPVIKNTAQNRDLLGTSSVVSTEGSALDQLEVESLVDETHVKYVDQGPITEILPSDFVEFAIRIPDPATKQLLPFSFDQRRYLRPIYDSTSPRVLFKCGRQVEKSTFLGNRILALTCIQPSFTALYVSPTNQQAKVFSNDRLREAIETSEKLKAWTADNVSNVFNKKFINRSQIVLRYAYLNADRVRGIAADSVSIDEIQDIIGDNISVIEECASHSAFRLFMYSGTPKSLDNTIESIWVNESTQNEWVVPCESCGGGDFRYWNVGLDEDNIGKDGLMCRKCKKLIDPMHADAQWAALVENPNVPHPFDGYRVSQLMVPWIKWPDILQKQLTYSRSKFFNEVLGLSFDSGLRPLTRQDVMDNCDSALSISTSEMEKNIRAASGKYVFAGIDWGAENSKTVMIIGTYTQSDKFSIIYAHRFEGRESEPQVQLELINQLIEKFKVAVVGVDYGGGLDRNDALIRKWGPNKIVKYQYSPLSSAKWKWEEGLKRFQVNRTEVMSDVFNAIKRRNVFRFPRWPEFERPYAQDMLNIFSEYSEERRCNEYKLTRGLTDDSFHALVLCFLVSQIKQLRPDVFVPNKEA
jgi:hypothetical protein